MPSKPSSPRIAIFGWGIVAPGAPDLAAFRKVIERGESVLRLAHSAELGHGLFAVGDPSFEFDDYREWIVSRDGEPRFNQLKSKMGDNAQFAIGACIQALESNPGVEKALRALDADTHVYVGSGVGDLRESYAAQASLTKATREWNRFWSDYARCAALRAYRDEGRMPPGDPPPVNPTTLPQDSDERYEALTAWHAYWAERSDALDRFEKAYAEIERFPVGNDVEKGPLHAIKARQRAHRKLVEENGCPTPPWLSVDPRLVWAIQNVPAAQISMLLGTHGAAFAPVGACSTFGLALKLARDAILRGDAKAVVVGSADPRPDPALISAFHRARLTPGSGEVNLPLTSMLGTHVSGGACVWIVADVDAMAQKGIRPIGPAIEGVGLSSDAEHIITPSANGPKLAIRRALSEAHAEPDDIAAWDMHATGTPGDASELKLSHGFIGEHTIISARKGILGHGMANAGGWEMTALAMGLIEGRAFPSGVAHGDVHPALWNQYGDAFATGMRTVEGRSAVKVLLGIGGITACIALGRP